MRSAMIVILDLSPTGSIGASLAKILAGSSENINEWRLEVSHVHQPSLDETRLLEVLSTSTPDIVLLILTRELHPHCGEILNLLKTRLGFSTVVAVSEARDPQEMFTLLRHGANEFLTVPIDRLNVLPRLWRLLENSSEAGQSSRELRTKVGLRQMLGRSPAWTEQISKIPLIARCDANVLITGDTGTGKE